MREEAGLFLETHTGNALKNRSTQQNDGAIPMDTAAWHPKEKAKQQERSRRRDNPPTRSKKRREKKRELQEFTVSESQSSWSMVQGGYSREHQRGAKSEGGKTSRGDPHGIQLPTSSPRYVLPPHPFLLIHLDIPEFPSGDLLRKHFGESPKLIPTCHPREVFFFSVRFPQLRNWGGGHRKTD